MSTPSALHSKKNISWGTPKDFADAARYLFGGSIDLDPASSPIFNSAIGARRIITAAEDGLVTPWRVTYPGPAQLIVAPPPTVFLNPPGGLVDAFWSRLIDEIKNGNVEKAFWVGFSVEQLCTLIGKAPYHPLDFSTVILRKRVKFTLEVPDPEKERPSHGNYMTALGVPHHTFAQLFSPMGKIIQGALAV
jgi:hypothetical protein